jgi:hypothetical protein
MYNRGHKRIHIYSMICDQLHLILIQNFNRHLKSLISILKRLICCIVQAVQTLIHSYVTLI